MPNPRVNPVYTADEVLNDCYDATAHLVRTDTTQVPSTTLGQGSKNIAAAGTPLQLAAVSTPCTAVAIAARVGNTKQVAYGGTNAVRATAGSEIGACLQPGDSVVLEVHDLQDVWVDAQVNGEGVSFTYAVD